MAGPQLPAYTTPATPMVNNKNNSIALNVFIRLISSFLFLLGFILVCLFVVTRLGMQGQVLMPVAGSPEPQLFCPSTKAKSFSWVGKSR